MIGLLLPVTAFGLLLQRPPLLGTVRVASRAALPPRAVPQVSMFEDPSDESWRPENYEPKRACELMIESMGLTYGDSRSNGNGGGKIIDDNYQSAVDSNGKAQVVLSYVTNKSSENYGHATVVFRGTVHRRHAHAHAHTHVHVLNNAPESQLARINPLYARAQDLTLPADLLRDIQYLTTSTECFMNNNETNSRGSDVYGTTDGTGFFEALKSSAQAPLGPQVHRGFAKRTLTYTRWVQDKLRQRFPPEKVTDQWNEGGIGNLTKLYVTGHSLGGAAALAFAYWVKLAYTDINPDLVVHVYVFSAPNVGNAAWAKEYNELLGDTTFQHNYGPDVVPQLPPWLWRVGHVVRLEHKTTDGFLGLTGKPTSTAQSAEPWPENMSVDDMSVNFPWFREYHLGLDRIFVPCVQRLEPTADRVKSGYIPFVPLTSVPCVCTGTLST